jgi:MGT family glycosyltransferase
VRGVAKFLWLNWSGGGNLPPSLGIARTLTERGHDIAFAGRPEMVGRVRDAGFRAIELERSYAQLDRYPDAPTARMACYLTSPEVVDEVRATIEAERPDMLLIDAMFPAAFQAAADVDVPSVAFFHHFLFRLRDEWNATGARLNGMRERAGFVPLPPLARLWQRCDRLVVTALAQFDTPADPNWASVRHVGPVLEQERCAIPVRLPWDDDAAVPLVLVSFSTAPEQRSQEKIQRTLDALAPAPVRVVVTTGGVVDPDELSIPHNAFVVPYAQHDPILQRASLTITHGGHGTLMRALKHGVPAIVMPGMAHDQGPNGLMLQELGAGLALAPDADPAAIRAAASAILSTPSFAERARLLSRDLAGADGAAKAATEIESLLSLHIGGSRA